MLPIGTYPAFAIEGGLADSSEGNPQAAVCLEIADGDHKGQQITWYGSFSKNKGEGTKTPLERTIDSLRTCGWAGDDLSDLSSISGAEVSIVIEHDEWKGETKAKVKWINRKGGLAVKTPMSAEKAKAFAAKMRGDVIAATRATGTPAPKPAASTKKPGRPDTDPPPLGDDDIPF